MQRLGMSAPGRIDDICREEMALRRGVPGGGNNQCEGPVGGLEREVFGNSQWPFEAFSISSLILEKSAFGCLKATTFPK